MSTATQRRIGGTLVVGADGYSSKIADLAALPGTVSTNNRFAYQATYRNVKAPDGWSGGVLVPGARRELLLQQ